jgi:uncharacterized protein YjiS (DUF1127 family)
MPLVMMRKLEDTMAQNHHPVLFSNTSTFIQRPSMAARLVDLLLDWNERARSRRQLAGLTEGELKDIGLNQSDVTIESSKPFWRF